MGEDKRFKFLQRNVANFPMIQKRKYKDQIRAVAAGDADIAIVNTLLFRCNVKW